jgi:hypothetical protein
MKYVVSFLVACKKFYEQVFREPSGVVVIVAISIITVAFVVALIGKKWLPGIEVTESTGKKPLSWRLAREFLFVVVCAGLIILGGILRYGKLYDPLVHIDQTLAIVGLVYLIRFTWWTIEQIKKPKVQ